MKIEIEEEKIKGLQWYPRFSGDYLRKTRHLSMLEHGAYNLLMDYYYAYGEPLSANVGGKADSNACLMPDHSRIYRICNAATEQERAAVDFVLGEFFNLTDGFYRNKRIDETLQEQREKHQKRVRAGKMGAIIKANKIAKAKQ